MNRRFEKRLLFVWLALSAITLAQLALGSFGEHGSLAPNAAVTSSAIEIDILTTYMTTETGMVKRRSA